VAILLIAVAAVVLTKIPSISSVLGRSAPTTPQVAVMGLSTLTREPGSAAKAPELTPTATHKAIPPSPTETPIPPTDTPLPPQPTDTSVSIAVLAPDDIMSSSAEKMSTATSAHITFEQQVLGQYTRRGWGDVAPLNQAAQFELAVDGEEPVEWIVIGSTGHWRDDTLPGGWNTGPVAPFSSNPAVWVSLSQHYANPTWLGDATINGIDCYHLQFTVDLDSLADLIEGRGAGEAWIAKVDYALVKAIYDLQYQSYRYGGNMKLTLELSRLNQPVSIIAPSRPTPTKTPAPKPTSTRRPLPTPTYTPMPVGDLLLVDDFGDPSASEFSTPASEARRLYFEDGEYHILVKKASWVSWGDTDTEFSDFSLEVEARLVDGAGEGQYGLIFREEDSDNFYMFNISHNGMYKLRKQVDGEWQNIIEWTESSHVRTGTSTNHLRVVCRGSEITMYVNGHYLDTVTDHSFSAGKLGVFAGTFNEPNFHVAFDNLIVWSALW